MALETKLDPRFQAGVAILRFGIAFVFFYFGISQLSHPETFVGWLPQFISVVPIEPVKFVLLNGAFELFCALLLSLGVFSRVAAFLLGMHLAGITFSIGFTEIGVRDFGLTIATLALSLTGPGLWSISNFFMKRAASSDY